MQVVDAGEGAGQVGLDELQRPAHRLEADLDEDARGILDVVARGLNQAGRLPQLREHAAGAFGRGRMREQGLPGDARRKGVGIVLRILFPRPNLFELEHPAAQIGSEHAVLEPLGRGQPLAVDFLEPSEIPGERMRLAVDRLAAEVFQKIVVRVDAVECRRGRVGLVEILEQVVDEMRQRFGRDHNDPPMVQ